MERTLVQPNWALISAAPAMLSGLSTSTMAATSSQSWKAATVRASTGTPPMVRSCLSAPPIRWLLPAATIMAVSNSCPQSCSSPGQRGGKGRFGGHPQTPVRGFAPAPRSCRKPDRWPLGLSVLHLGEDHAARNGLQDAGDCYLHI